RASRMPGLRHNAAAMVVPRDGGSGPAARGTTIAAALWRRPGMRDALDSRVKTIFGAAFELRGPPREALLVASCGEDTALRRRVEDLLAAAEQEDGFLKVGDGRSGVASADGVRAGSSGESPGTLIGNYRIVSL